MNVTCNKCGKRYVIADEKIAGKASVKIRCKQCQNLIHLTSGALRAATALASSVAQSADGSAAAGAPGAQRSPWDDEATRAMPAPDLTTQWFAMVQGKQEGPIDLRGLMVKVGAGEVTLRTYLWKPGMDGWKRAAEVPEVSSIFASPRPSSGASATATGLQASQAPRASVPRRDVAVANELPAADFASASQIIAGPVVDPIGSTRAPVTSAPLQDLFNDDAAVETPKVGAETPATDGSFAQAPGHADEHDDDYEPTKGDDPFAALGEASPSEAPPPGEATKFFIAQAGVNRRNPPWKIAVFVVLVFVAPTTTLYLLSTLHVLPTVTVTTADGQVVQENFFSPSGITGLKDILTGDKARKVAEAEERRRQQQASKERAVKEKMAGSLDKPVKTEKESAPVAKADPNLAAFYENDTKKGNAPKDRTQDTSGPTASSSGLSNDAAMKIVADKRKSFEQCIDTALRRTPNLAVGNIVVTLTVGSSGAVKAVGVAPKKWEGADWAQCMMTAGKRIVFPSADADTDIEVPLKVGVTL